MDDLREEIVRLEDRIEELAGAIESCRKFILAARIAIATGGVLLLALVVGVIEFSPMAMVAALAAVIGGIVLLGSNDSTSREANAALHAAETERAALIGRIDLHVVSGNGGGAPHDAPHTPTLH